MRERQIWSEIKLFLKVFLVVFAITFFIFNGNAFISLLKYKTKNFISQVLNELTRPPDLSFLTNKTNTSSFKSVVFSTTSQNNNEAAIHKNLNPPLINQTNLLVLPQFDIQAPILSVDKPDLKLIYRKLREGVVLFPGSDPIGKGFSIIIGHSSAYPWSPGRYKSVFSLLSQFKKGDRFYIYWQNKRLVFEVINKKIFLPWPKGQERTETIFPRFNQPTVILESCWPVGVDQKRIAIQAILIEND